MSVTTPTSANGWRPDAIASIPIADAIPGALMLRAGTVAGRIDGDAPVIRVPYVTTDPTATFTAEGAPIAESTPGLGEVAIPTSKIAALARVSRESVTAAGGQVSALIDSFRRSLLVKANAVFAANPAAAGQPTGLANLTGVTAGGTLGADLDVLVDAFATCQANGGNPDRVLASPSTWAAVRKLKGAGNIPLIGSVESSDAAPTLLGAQVLIDRHIADGILLVADSTDLLIAAGDVEVTTSEDVFFSSDSIGVRGVLRIGWAAAHPDRIVTVTVTNV